jgi:hypothetical protein
MKAQHLVRMKLNGTYHHLIYADGVNLLGNNINAINKNTEAVIEASKEICVEVIIEITELMLMYCLKDSGQNHNIKVANKCFENVTKFRYLEMTITNQNLIQGEIKSRLNSGILATVHL